MIAAIINDPHLERSIIVVVIEPDNLKRMSAGDPATLETTTMGGVLPTIVYPENYAILIAYEQDEAELYKKASAGELLLYLERGRKFIRGVDGTENSFRIPRD